MRILYETTNCLRTPKKKIFFLIKGNIGILIFSQSGCGVVRFIRF